jgi:phospholipid transport system substrate-binding protein
MHSPGFWTLLMLGFHLVATPVLGDTHPAVQVVENLHTSLVAVMKESNHISFVGRYNRLAPVITASYDLPFVAKAVVGRYWDSFSPEQKSKFMETFAKLSISTYASNFDAYSGERFIVLSEKILPRGRVLVETKLIQTNGREITLDYILHEVANQWRIINVIAEGVSDLALKRADYSSFLKKKNIEALIAKLNEKIEEYSH